MNEAYIRDCIARGKPISAKHAADLLAERNKLSSWVGELNTTIGYQDAKLRQAAVEIARLRESMRQASG